LDGLGGEQYLGNFLGNFAHGSDLSNLHMQL
jgi:hypothetical protein